MSRHICVRFPSITDVSFVHDDFQSLIIKDVRRKDVKAENHSRETDFSSARNTSGESTVVFQRPRARSAREDRNSRYGRAPARNAVRNRHVDDPSIDRSRKRSIDCFSSDPGQGRPLANAQTWRCVRERFQFTLNCRLPRTRDAL